MKKVQSSRKIKFSQLRLWLCDLLIKIKETFTKVKLKIVSNLAKITGRRWWLHLNHTTLFHLKTKSNKNTYTSIETALRSWIYT